MEVAEGEIGSGIIVWIVWFRVGKDTTGKGWFRVGKDTTGESWFRLHVGTS